MNFNKSKELNNGLLIKYEELREEKDRLLLIKDEIKKKVKEKEKGIKIIDEKIKNNKEKLKEVNSNINKEQNLDNNVENELENLKILNNIHKETERIYLDEIELLKQKILKLEEKNNLFNKIK